MFRPQLTLMTILSSWFAMRGILAVAKVCTGDICNSQHYFLIGWCANSSCRRVLVTHADGRQTVEEIKVKSIVRIKWFFMNTGLWRMIWELKLTIRRQWKQTLPPRCVNYDQSIHSEIFSFTSKTRELPMLFRSTPLEMPTTPLLLPLQSPRLLPCKIRLLPGRFLPRDPTAELRVVSRQLYSDKVLIGFW